MVGLAAEWLLLIVGSLVGLFIVHIGVSIMFDLMGRASESFENALAFALAACLVIGYCVGRAGFLSHLDVNWGEPLSAGWVSIVIALIITGALAEEISGREHRAELLQVIAVPLTGWQRLWIAVAVVLLIPAMGAAITLRPVASESVLRDLRNPVCQEAGVVSGAAYGEPCFALRSFNEENRRVATEQEYVRTIDRQRFQTIAWCLVAWLIIIASLYVSGLTLRWIGAGFRKSAA